MIEFQYFKGCPHYKITLDHLEELIREGIISKDELIITEMDNPELAKRIHFQGSPTILLDGLDLYTGEQPQGFSYSCRIYQIDGKMTGILPKDYIRKKMKR